MFIETDIVENEMREASVDLQMKAHAVLRTIFESSVDLSEAEAIVGLAGRIIKKASTKIDTKKFNQR